MADTALFEYNGPRARIVALDADIEGGQQVWGPVELESVYGFTRLKSAKASDSKLINSRDDGKEAVEAVGGSGEQTEADR